MRGLAADGHAFIDDAVRRGAVAVVAERPAAADAVVITVPSTRRALAELSARFFGAPSEQLTVVAVTGTNGKTTTSFLVESILERAGHRTGVIGTIETRYAGRSFASPVTTPESLDLQRILADMRGAGVTHVVLEASSHAIDLSRIHCCWMDVAVFTNLSQDHLNYHADMHPTGRTSNGFLGAARHGPQGRARAAVVNADSAHGRELAGRIERPVIRVGTGAGFTVRGEELVCSQGGIRGAIRLPGERFEFASPLVGRHNIENILCAAGAGAALALPAARSAPALKPSRCSRPAGAGRKRRRAPRLRGLRTHAGRPRQRSRPCAAHGRADHLCLRLRRGPRPQQAAAHGRNRRAPERSGGRHLRQPALGRSAGHHRRDPPRHAPRRRPAERTEVVVEPDRRRAIEIALSAARPGDTVLIAGKGHETYQIIGGRTIHFDDREEAARALERLEGRSLNLNLEPCHE